MSIKEKNKQSGVNPENKSDNSENEISSKKYVALKTIKITADAVFDLVEGQEIPKEINENLIKSLISSKLIKQL